MIDTVMERNLMKVVFEAKTISCTNSNSIAKMKPQFVKITLGRLFNQKHPEFRKVMIVNAK